MNCYSLTSADFPLLITLGELGFSQTSISSFNFPLLETAGGWAFANRQIISYDFSSLYVVGEQCFANSFYSTTVDFPSLTTATGFAPFQSCCNNTFNIPNLNNPYNACFYYCTGSTFNLPGLINTGVGSFQYCSSSIFNLPNLQIAGQGSFGGCKDIPELYLPSLTTINLGAFMATDIKIYNFPNLINLGENVGYNRVFENTNSISTTLIIPSGLTANYNLWGYPGPDGDILYFQHYNDVNIQISGAVTTSTTTVPVRTMYIHIPNL